MPRSVPEWIGKTPDTPAPPRVRLRVFERDKGMCHISGRKIAAGEKWELEHIIPLIQGGENREGNLAPALVKPHKEKTRQEVAQKAKEARVRQKHRGIRPAGKKKLQGRPFPKAEAQHSASRKLRKRVNRIRSET